MELEALNKEYDNLQLIYGAKELDSIYNGGCVQNPDICFVFMNPTRRNIASNKEWKGLKSPWIGTKNIWDLFYSTGLLDEYIYRKIGNLVNTDKVLLGPFWVGTWPGLDNDCIDYIIDKFCSFFNNLNNI